MAKMKAHPTYERWTDADENELLEASKTKITVDDTALGRAQMKKEQDFVQAVETMSKEE